MKRRKGQGETYMSAKKRKAPVQAQDGGTPKRTAASYSGHRDQSHAKPIRKKR